MLTLLAELGEALVLLCLLLGCGVHVVPCALHLSYPQ